MVPMQKVSGTPKLTQSKASQQKIQSNKILIVCGPTASGKTKFAISLAHRFNGELVNADSRQMYKGMDVLSGKDMPPGVQPQIRGHRVVKGDTIDLVTYDMDGIPLWLYDVAPISCPLSVSHFQEIARYVISDIHTRGKLPIIVGGTGFYLSSLVDRIGTIHIPQDQVLRDELKQQSVEYLQTRLAQDDAYRWQQMNMSDKYNPRRLIRGIEVAKWMHAHEAAVVEERHVDACWIGLTLDQVSLSQRITSRVSTRFEHGAVEEVKQLGEISDTLPAGSMIGVSVLGEYIRNVVTLGEAKRLWAMEELQYAKRQMVWFAKRTDIHWFDSGLAETQTLLEKLVYEWYT